MNYFSHFVLTERKIVFKIFIILGFLISWSSLATNISDITTIVSTNKISLTLLVNFLRSIAVVIYFLSILFFYILFYKKINFEIKNKIFYLLFFLYFLLQIPGLLLTDNSLNNIYYIISSLNIILILNLALDFFDKSEIKLFSYISFFFLFSIFFVFFIKDLHTFLFYKGSFYSNFSDTAFVLNKLSPRSSGMSRTAILLLLFFTMFAYNLKKKYFRYIIILFFSTIVFLYQSRTSLGLLFGVVILEIFFMQKYNFKSILKKLSFFLIIPFIIFTSITLIKSSILLNKMINEKMIFLDFCSPILNHKIQHYLYDKAVINNCWNVNDLLPDVIIIKSSTSPVETIKSKLSHTHEISEIRHKLIRNKQINFSSNRFDDWSAIINLFANNKNISFLLFGAGSQADRFLIDQTASNGLIYALVSSGSVGLAFLILSLILLLFKVFFLVSSNKNLLLKNSQYTYIIIILVLLARSTLETSFAVFGIDFMLLITSVAIIQKKTSDN